VNVTEAEWASSPHGFAANLPRSMLIPRGRPGRPWGFTFIPSNTIHLIPDRALFIYIILSIPILWLNTIISFIVRDLPPSCFSRERDFLVDLLLA